MSNGRIKGITYRGLNAYTTLRTSRTGADQQPRSRATKKMGKK